MDPLTEYNYLSSMSSCFVKSLCVAKLLMYSILTTFVQALSDGQPFVPFCCDVIVFLLMILHSYLKIHKKDRPGPTDDYRNLGLFQI